MPMAVMLTTKPGPYIEVSKMADNKAGNANVKSAARMTTSSTHPRLAEANKPSGTPAPKPMPTAMNPTSKEF